MIDPFDMFDGEIVQVRTSLLHIGVDLLGNDVTTIMSMTSIREYLTCYIMIYNSTAVEVYK